MGSVYENEIDALELYHKLRETTDSRSIPSAPVSGLPALGHALAGSAGTAISHLLLYPLDTAITRLQVQSQFRSAGETPSAARSAGVEYVDLPDAVRKIYAAEGIAGFYQGCATDTAKSILDAFLFFLTYNLMRQRRRAATGRKNLSVPAELAVGMLAGAVAKAVTTPVQQIVTRKQTAALLAARHPSPTAGSRSRRPTSIAAIVKDIYAARGLQGFWAGYSASLILTLNPALTFLIQNTLGRILRSPERKSNRTVGSSSSKTSALSVFCIAAVSKAVASSVTYPFSVAKTRAQVSSPASGAESAKTGPPSCTGGAPGSLTRLLPTVLTGLHAVYRSRGVGALYSGLSGELVKGFVGHGLTMALKDRIHLLIVALYFLLARTGRRLSGVGSAFLTGSVRDEAVRELARVRALVERAADELQDVVDKVKDSVVERIAP